MQSFIKIKANFKCIIGMLEYERIEKQKITLKISAISDTFLDYGQVLKLSKQYIKKKKFFKLEKAAKKLAKKLKKTFPKLKKINIQIIKPKIIKNSKLGIRYKKKY